MIEVFKNNIGESINDIDEKIRRKTFIYIWNAVLLVGLIGLIMLVLLIAKLSARSISINTLLINTGIAIACVGSLVWNRMTYRKEIGRIIENNKGIIYTSKEIAITESHIFIDGVHPIKMK